MLAALVIYFIDVEGGQSTLLVTPSHESLLVDTGWAGDGSPEARAGDPAKARDAQRILAAATNAGIKQIDYLLITHFHTDHDGGAVELSQLIPIRHFIDHGTLSAEVQKDTTTKAAYEGYLAIRNKGEHVEPKPGDRIPLHDVNAVIVASAGSTIKAPLPGAGGITSSCSPTAPPARDLLENPRSTGFVATFGKFRFLDVGDLSGQPLYDLACPRSLIGPVSVYLVAHHGGADAADPATFAALQPRVAMLNNGLKKGGAHETLEALHHVSGLEDVWQLHRSEGAGDLNFAAERTANLDESTAHWIKLSAQADGSFQIENGRTGQIKKYP
jgi:beta-lactamase superfamily II metal-dependent hydrolase